MISSKDKIFNDSNVQSSAKMLYIFIKEKGKVELTNEELAVQFGVTSVSINNWLTKLVSLSYIKIENKDKIKVIKSL
jgi:Mn-dependent DtxR family transcriptional regulator